MHRILLFFILIVSYGNAQTSFDKVKFDFGVLYKHSDRFVDFYITNNSAKKVFLLRIDKPRPISSLFKTDVIAPKDTMVLRLQVNPTTMGLFSYDINVFLSDAIAPTTIKLTGNAKEINLITNAMQACPDFSQQPRKSADMKFDLTVVVVEKGSGLPIKNTVVSLIQNGLLARQEKTNKKGEIIQKGASGYFYFYARHEGYFPSEKGVFIHRDNNSIVLKLEKNPAFRPIKQPTIKPIDTLPTIAKDSFEAVFDTTTIKLSNINGEPIELSPKLDSIAPKNAPLTLKSLPLTTFGDTYFMPNNITFVLDISMSMRTNDKMELMKFALNQLVGYMRPQDNISIVTYASFAQIVIANASGNEKASLKKTVGELKGGGYTAGGTGIKLGYKQVRKGHIENGNNEIIVITDGAFNRGEEDYKQIMKRYTKKGYVLSVVGIKNNPKDEEEMRRVAKLGNGRYIPIFKLEDAKWNLIREMRKASFKGN